MVFKKAFDSFDFEQIVIDATKQAIKSELQASANYGKLREVVRKKADEIAENYLDKQFKELTNKLNRENEK